MKFLTQSASASAGWHLAQAVRLGDQRLPKGSVLTPSQAATLGERQIQVYALETGDLSEDDAASALQASLFGEGLRTTSARTGRVNALADSAGLLWIDTDGVTGFNTASEALTLATLPPLQRVEQGDLVATLKIIPFAVAQHEVEQARPAQPLLRVQPLRTYAITLIQTQPETVKDNTLDKSRDALAARLETLGSRIVTEHRVQHDAQAVASVLADATGELIIIFPGAATQDRRDVGPAGLIQAGGQVDHVGMPVDPGNLLFIGSLNGTPVIGAPGCARSVAFNGFDWVLERACADLFPTAIDIQTMGVGGLLKEIKSRPLPRLKA